MLDLILLAFLGAFLALGLKRPFIWVLVYIYVDIVLPQKIGWVIMPMIPISLIAFAAAFGGWLFLDNKKGAQFSLRQGLIALLLVYCGMTTFLLADFPVEAGEKWSWVWKSLLFAIVFPLTLRTKLRLEAAALVICLALGSIVISTGIKTVFSGGGGYGSLVSLVKDNSGIYEGSTLSTVAIASIPLFLWVGRYGTIFKANRWTFWFALALTFAALLVPVGTQTRTGLLCIGSLGVLSLRSVKYRFLYAGAAAFVMMAAIPFLPASYTERMSTITDHTSDESASTRVAVWGWTLDYVKDNPLGGGFDAFLGNSFTYNTRKVVEEGGASRVVYEEVVDEGRAYHSAYFEVLGEQGFPGLLLWLTMHALGLWQMEKIRRRYSKSEHEQEKSWHALATALQHAQLILLLGALFVGIGYQPYVYLIIGLQIGLVGAAKRWDAVHGVSRSDAGKSKPWLAKQAARPVGPAVQQGSA